MPDHKPFRTTRRIANLRQGRNDWYRIKALADEPSQLHIYDEIGFFGVTAGDMIADLAGIKGDLEVHLNTPGGEVFDGIAIYNALRQRDGIVRVVIDSLAASIGSVIAMAADPGNLIIAKNASMMIHDGFGMGIGNAKDLRDLADLLDKTSDNIASIYADRTGQPAAQWRDAMLAETWYVGQEAVDAGLADFIQGAEPEDAGPAIRIASTWDLSIFAKRPGQPQAAADAGDGGDDIMHGDHERYDPDGDGDCDACPEGDTDHDYWSEDGRQLKPLPGKPMDATAVGVPFDLPAPSWQAVEQVRAVIREELTAIRNSDKYDADDRKRMGSSGEAMPDGSYPIADEEDLGNAIHAVGRGGADHDAIRRHIIKRADALGLSSRIPDNWAADGSIKEGTAENHIDPALSGAASTTAGDPFPDEWITNIQAALEEAQWAAR